MKYLFILFLLITTVAFSQVKVSGIVIDEFKEPVSFASVTFKGSTVGTVSDENGKLLIDYIVKFEERQKDLSYVSKKLHIENIGVTELNKITSSNRHYSMFYDDELANIIAKIYKNDIEMFGYAFDEGNSA